MLPPTQAPKPGMQAVVSKANAELGAEDASRILKYHKTPPTEIQLFSLIPCSPGCCKLLISTQSSKKVDFERFLFLPVYSWFSG